MKLIMDGLITRISLSQNNDRLLYIFAQIFIEISSKYYKFLANFINELSQFSIFLVRFSFLFYLF